MATTYSITKAGLVNHNNIKELLYANTLLLHEILRKSEQHQIVKEQDNQWFVSVLRVELLELTEELIRVSYAVRENVERTVA